MLDLRSEPVQSPVAHRRVEVEPGEAVVKDKRVLGRDVNVDVTLAVIDVVIDHEVNVQ